MVLPVVSLLFIEELLVSVSSFVVLCAVQWRGYSVSPGPFPVYVPSTICASQSSPRPVDQGMFSCFFAELRFPAECLTDEPADVQRIHCYYHFAGKWQDVLLHAAV